MDKAEARLRERYLAGWMQAMNNPEQYRLKAAVITEAIATIRGELNDGY